MATYSDDFNRGGPGLGSEWTTVSGTWQIYNGYALQHQGSTDSKDLVYFNTPLSSVSQYAQFWVYSDNPSKDFLAPSINLDPSTSSYYRLLFRSGSCSIQELIGGSITTLVENDALGSQSGSLLRLEREGNTLKAYRDGALLLTHNITGTALSGLYTGISGKYRIVDDFQCGDLAQPTPTLGTITTTSVTSNSISFSLPVTY